MTREEAIQWLTSLKPFDHGKYEEAIDMAISALSAEPNEDLVQRSDVLEIISEAQDGSGSTYEILQPIFEKVNGMPSCHRCYECDEALLKQVTSKLKNPCDSLLTEDSEDSKEQKSKLDHDREWIIGCIKHDGFIKTGRFDKANQIILEALELTEPSDLISRAEALEEVARLVGRIDSLPSVSAERVGVWIPFSEKLPNKHENCLITYKWIGVSGTEYLDVDTFDNWFGEGTIIAWQPLPKPYEAKMKGDINP